MSPSMCRGIYVFVLRGLAAALVLLALCQAPLASAQPPIRISFDEDEIGKVPSGWTSRNRTAEEVYSVRAEGPSKYLHADAGGTSVQIGLERKWSLKDLPFLEWSWRPILFPSSTDERKKGGDDSVLGVYVLFGKLPFLSAIKYIWSDTLPVDMSFDSPFSQRTKFIVVESGRTLTGRWVTERRDVLSDYHRLFGRTEAPEATGIAVLTDADNSASRAIGDYGGFALMPPEPGALSR